MYDGASKMHGTLLLSVRIQRAKSQPVTLEGLGASVVEKKLCQDIEQEE